MTPRGSRLCGGSWKISSRRWCSPPTAWTPRTSSVPAAAAAAAAAAALLLLRRLLLALLLLVMVVMLLCVSYVAYSLPQLYDRCCAHSVLRFPFSPLPCRRRMKEQVFGATTFWVTETRPLATQTLELGVVVKGNL